MWIRAGLVARPFLPAIAALVTFGVLAHLVSLLEVCARFAREPAAATLPPPWLYLIVPASAAVGLTGAFFADWRRNLVAGVCVAAGMIALAARYPGLLPVSLAAPVAAAGIAVWHRKGGGGIRKGLLAGALLTVALTCGAWFRFRVLPGMLMRELDPDAITFMRLAEESFIYNTQMREPLFIWMIKIMRLFSGEYSAPALRLFGIMLGLLTILVLFEFTRRHIGLVAATIAALLYAVAPAFVFTAPRGLREDITTAIFLLFSHFVIREWGRPPTLRSYAVLGFFLFLSSAIRLSSFAFCSAVIAATFAYSVYRHRVPPARWWIVAVPVALTVALLVPYLWHSHKKFGDAFYCVNIVPRFYANLEFAGQPGFPTKKETEADMLTGPRITMGEYVFKHHTTVEVARRVLDGAWRLWLSKDFRDFPTVAAPNWSRNPREWMWHFGDFNLQNQPLLRVSEANPIVFPWLQTLGLAALCFPGRRLFFTLLFLSHVPLLFLASIPEFDWRLLATALAGFYIGIGALGESVVEWGRILAAKAAGRGGEGGNGRAAAALPAKKRERS